MVKMSRVNHLSNGKSVMILGTVVGCLIILWPKIFYPMMMSGGSQVINQDLNVKSKIHPRMVVPKSPPKKFNGQSNFHGPDIHIPTVDQNSIGGASVGLIMTIYTAGIIFLFFYTIFKFFRSDDSLDDSYLDEGDSGQAYCDTGLQGKVKKGEPTFDTYDHEQGECLKKLAINYVRCKSKLSDDEIEPAISNDEDGVSMAYRTLLGDMLELRDYLFELQCSINGCEPCDDELCDCSDQIIYNTENVYESEPNDFGFDLNEAIDQMFGSDGVQDEKDDMKTEGKASEKDEPELDPELEADSVEKIDDLIGFKVENETKRLNKKGAKEE